MCFGGNDNAADDAKRQRRDMERREAARQAAIKSGKKNINSAFGQFNDSYYGDFKKAHLDYYLPQLDTQYAEANGKMIAALAGRGMLESTVGADKSAGLLTDYNTQRTGIANEAQSAANKLKSTVENSKTDLYALNSASEDPAAMGARAVGQASTLVASPPFSPLGQVFASSLQPLVAAQNAYNTRPDPRYPEQAAPPPAWRQPRGQGSGRVVPG